MKIPRKIRKNEGMKKGRRKGKERPINVYKKETKTGGKKELKIKKIGKIVE